MIGHTRFRSKLTDRQGLSTHQSNQHIGARRITNERCDMCNIWAFFHSSTIIEAFLFCNPVIRNKQKGTYYADMHRSLSNRPNKEEVSYPICTKLGEVIPRYGADLIGYFAQHEGSSTLAYGIYNIASLAEYESYRERLSVDPLGQENYAFAQKEKFLLREERTFLELASAPHGLGKQK